MASLKHWAFLLAGTALALASCGGGNPAVSQGDEASSSNVSSSLPPESLSSSEEEASSSAGESLDSLEEGEKEIVGTFLDDWALSDDPAFFLWAWVDGGEPGRYYAGEVVDGFLESRVPSEIDSLIVLRYDPSGTLPTPGQDTWVDGDWNVTDTIALSGTTYEISFIPGY